MASFAQRMIGAAKLDARVYEEVEADTSALGQAMAVVVLASLAAGIGGIAHKGIMGLILGTVVALVGWFIWALLIYFIGAKLLPEPQTSSNVGELLRTIGFADTPGLLHIMGLVPILGGVIGIVVSIWMLIAMVVAVRQALDYTSTLRAVGVCILGWLVVVVLAALVMR
jgi:hypothetical protein